MHFFLGTFSHLTAPLPSLSLCLPHSKSIPYTQVLSFTIFSSSQQYWCSRSMHWKSSLVVTFKVDPVHAGPVLHNLLLVPAVLVLKINALEVVLGSHIQIIHSITDPISNSGTSLHGVGLVHHLVLNVLHQLTYQLSHIKALSVLRLLDDRGAVLLVDVLALFNLLGVACLLYIRQTFILINSA